MKKKFKALVSIIVPVYNVEKYLSKCLDSLVNQTFSDLEIIVVNDGSTDNCKDIIEKYEKKYSNIIKVLNQSNQGLSDARNNGLKLATADYIMYVDSDDYINLDMVEKMYNKITKDNADVVICGNNVVDEDYNILSSSYPDKNNYTDIIEQTIFGNMCAWNKIYKKSLICNNHLKFRSRVWYEDIDFSYKLLICSKKITFLKENLYNYLLRKDSIMNNKKANRNLELLLSFNEIIDYSKQNSVYEKFYPAIEYLCINHIYIAAVTRIINSQIEPNNKKKLIKEFILYVKNNFPNFKYNKYLKKISKNKKIIYILINLKQYWLVKLIFSIKKGVAN